MLQSSCLIIHLPTKQTIRARSFIFDEDVASYKRIKWVFIYYSKRINRISNGKIYKMKLISKATCVSIYTCIWSHDVCLYQQLLILNYALYNKCCRRLPMNEFEISKIAISKGVLAPKLFYNHNSRYFDNQIYLKFCNDLYDLLYENI